MLFTMYTYICHDGTLVKLVITSSTFCFDGLDLEADSVNHSMYNMFYRRDTSRLKESIKVIKSNK